MEMNTNKNFNLGKVTGSLKKISEATGKMIESNLNSNLQWMNELQNVFGLATKKKDDCGACPPDCDCPPNCLISISREAHVGEVIIVPFKVKNTLQIAKVYKVGVRPFSDDNGNPLPEQPLLNKTELNLEPGQSVLVLMRINLLQGYAEGYTYQTEIVIREKDVNQNICFTLHVTANSNIPEAKPLKEEAYFNHFQDWKSHFYCEKKPTINRIVTNLDS